MASSIQEFRERARKIVTLPSGLSVEIRKVWLIDFFSLGELPLPSSESDDKEKPDSTRKILSQAEADKYAARAIIKGAIDPCFSEEESAQEDKVWIKELSYEDFQYLAGEILAWSGSKKEAAAEADAFRLDAVGDNGAGAGGEVRAAAGRDITDGAGRVLSQPDSHVPGDREKEKAS